MESFRWRTTTHTSGASSCSKPERRSPRQSGQLRFQTGRALEIHLEKGTDRESSHLAGPREDQCGRGAGSADPAAHRRGDRGDLDRDLRIGPAPVLGARAYLSPGDILGHETMGIVREVGSAVTGIKPGDRVVVPFNISCGDCWMCDRGLFAQCETTQVREQGSGAALFGYTELYGSVPGGQAEFLRVPQAQFGPDRSRRRARRAGALPVRHPAHRLAGRGVRRRCPPTAPSPCSASARSASWPPGSRGFAVIG